MSKNYVYMQPQTPEKREKLETYYKDLTNTERMRAIKYFDGNQINTFEGKYYRRNEFVEFLAFDFNRTAKVEQYNNKPYYGIYETGTPYSLQLNKTEFDYFLWLRMQYEQEIFPGDYLTDEEMNNLFC